MDSPKKTRLESSNDSREWLENSLEEVSSGLDQSASSPVTPKSDRIHAALSFGNGSSDVSPNHESDSSYSELDSEAEAFYSSLNHQLVSSGTMDSEKPMSYSELMKKLGEYEEELRTNSLKLQDSEQEIEKLKGEKRESAVLFAELEAARREIETKDTEIESEKRRALGLQEQVVDLESQLSDLRFNVGNVVDELHRSKECLAGADAEISKLKLKFFTERTKLESEISSLLENQTFLEDQIKHSDAEKMEMKSREVSLEAEINALKTDLASRDDHMEALNKDFDKHKLRYDMLMAEKDGVCAEVNTLKAEMRTRDIQIKQMEEQVNQLVYRQTELMSESGNAKNTVEELRAMVTELEKQAELRRNVVSEVEGEKREAIRQLCFSLDHYKTGYRQLLRSLSSNENAITGNHGRVI